MSLHLSIAMVPGARSTGMRRHVQQAHARSVPTKIRCCDDAASCIGVLPARSTRRSRSAAGMPRRSVEGRALYRRAFAGSALSSSAISSALTTSSRPAAAAACRGVWPAALRAHGSAPASSSSSVARRQRALNLLQASRAGSEGLGVWSGCWGCQSSPAATPARRPFSPRPCMR